ncbi:MAG: hypothetical protein C0518_08805 [Opitutus sp.]|nr:hypothetical protein [Opitutus sp.]
MLTRTLRVLALFCLAATLAHSADTVELLPGKITGSIQLTSETVTNGSVSASATDGSGSASSSFSGESFSIVVPAGKTWKLNFNLSLATANNSSSQLSINTAENITVGANEIVTQNYVISTARVAANVQVANGTLSSYGYFQAYGTATSSGESVSFSSYSQGSGLLTVLPASGVTVYGTAYLLSTANQSSTVALPGTSVDVPVGGTAVTWNVDAAFISSTVQGALTLNGGPTVSSAQVYLYGPSGSSYGAYLNGNGTFQFDNLKAGSYSAYAYANFPESSLYLYRNLDVAEGAVTALNFNYDLATARVDLNVTGFLADASLYGSLYGSGPDNSSGYAQLNSSRYFAPVVTAGAWAFSQVSLSGNDTNGYFSLYSYDQTRASNPTTFAAGDNPTLAPFSLNTTEAEFTFDVVEAAGATSETLISNPSIQGYTYKYDANSQYIGYSSINAQSYAYGQAKPRVRVVGEPGTYTFQAYGYVDGSNVSFGNFTIELKTPLPTPVGTNVTVTPGAGVTLEFDNVTTAGVTTVSQLPVGPTLPAGYSNLTSDGAKIYYSASTTATFNGYIDVTISFDPSTVAAELEAGLHLFYYDKPSETWIDITTSVDTVNNTITGVAPGLSTFAIGLPHAPVIGTITVPVGGMTDTPLAFTAAFTDADSGDVHSAVWSWGNGAGSNTGVVAAATGTILGEHTFTTGGTYEGTLTLTDATGNVVTKNFVYSVTGNTPVDTTAPVITTSGNITVEATSANGAAVNFTASATDATDGSVAVSTSAVSGATFALGTTTVTASATDAAGNVANTSFTITVADTIAPVISGLSNLVLEATSAAGATATFAATATDATGATLSYSTASGSTFALGTSTVTVTATDAVGNKSTATFTVTVRDSVAPTISSVKTNVASLWPANHKMVAVTVTAVATDLGGAVSYRITSATSSEPDNGLGDGDTANDIQITGAMTLNLRAERSGSGNGRTYTITVEAKDASGNTSTQTVTVSVPKSQGK